jgi:fucose permease
MEPKEPSVRFKTLLTGYLYLLMLAYGLYVTMIGPLMPELIGQYSLRMSQGGLIVSSNSMGGLLIILLGGILIDRLPKSRLIAVLFLLYSIWLLLVGTSPIYIVLLLLFFALGATTRMLDIVLNAFTADLYPERRGFFLNLLHTFFGIGAFLGPVFARALLNLQAEWHIVFLILGCVCLLIFTLYITMIRRQESIGRNHASEEQSRSFSWLRSPRIWFLCLVMILYAGHQTGVTVWLPMYLQTHLRTDVNLASYALSVFWLGIIAGRIASSLLTTRFDPKHLVLWGCLFGGLFLVAGIVSGLPLVLIAAAGITGMLTGSTIPLLITMGCGWFPSSSGSVTSLLYLNSNLAKMVFPWLVGFIADSYSFRFGMHVTGVTLLLASLVILPLPRSHAATGSRDSTF